MKKHTGSDGTFRSVRGKHQEWFGKGDRGFLPGRTVADDDYDRPGTGAGGDEMKKMIELGIGGGIGLVLLALAAYSISNAGSWAAIERDGAAVGYALVGVFLIIAGLGALIATWNHQFRVAGHPPSH